MNKCTTEPTARSTTTRTRTLTIVLPEDVARRLAARLRNEIVLDGRIVRKPGTPPRRGHQQARDDRAFIQGVKSAIDAPLFGLTDLDPYDGGGRVLSSYEPDCGDCDAGSDACYLECAHREARYDRD